MITDRQMEADCLMGSYKRFKRTLRADLFTHKITLLYGLVAPINTLKLNLGS